MTYEEIIEKWTSDALEGGRRSDIAYAIESAMREQAIAFGEWIRHNCSNHLIKESKFSYWELKSNLGNPITTEELYKLFLDGGK